MEVWMDVLIRHIRQHHCCGKQYSNNQMKSVNNINVHYITLNKHCNNAEEPVNDVIESKDPSAV